MFAESTSASQRVRQPVLTMKRTLVIFSSLIYLIQIFVFSFNNKWLEFYCLVMYFVRLCNKISTTVVDVVCFSRIHISELVMCYSYVSSVCDRIEIHGTDSVRSDVKNGCLLICF